jgi:hypothetical protein
MADSTDARMTGHLQCSRNLQPRGLPGMASCGNQIGNSSTCRVFNWDILSRCMEIAFD